MHELPDEHFALYFLISLACGVQDMGVCVSCLAAVGTRLWVGLADGRIKVLGERPGGVGGAAGGPGGVVVEEEWLAHEAGVSALVPARSRVVSMAADGNIRAWCSTLPCPEEQQARSASLGPQLSTLPVKSSLTREFDLQK